MEQALKDDADLGARVERLGDLCSLQIVSVEQGPPNEQGIPSIDVKFHFPDNMIGQDQARLPDEVLRTISDAFEAGGAHGIRWGAPIISENPPSTESEG